MIRPSTPAGAGQPKAMSSRLLTMKFMQRAAASSNRSPSTAADTPIRDTPDSASNKLLKLTGSGSSTPGTPSYPKAHSTDISIVSAALGAEERSRSGARVRSAAAGGETEWILNLPSVNGSMNRHLSIQGGITDCAQDNEELGEDEIWQDHTTGRRSYGGFKRKNAQVGTTSSYKSSEDAEELSEADVSDSDFDLSPNPAKKPKLQDTSHKDMEKKRWQAMDKMNLKGQNHISGFSPKRAFNKRTSKVKKRPQNSSKS